MGVEERFSAAEWADLAAAPFAAAMCVATAEELALSELKTAH